VVQNADYPLRILGYEPPDRSAIAEPFQQHPFTIPCEIKLLVSYRRF